jgi:methylmalonyl-CoA/ethylmalonyl-CoA epimerase
VLENFGLRFHHFGLAARDVATATTFLKGLGYRCEAAVFDPLQNVDLTWCRHETMPSVEIISPSSQAETGGAPVENLLKKRPEGIIYHLCYSSGDLEGSLARMHAAGVQVKTVSPPTPAILFRDKPVSFYMIAGLGLIEIVEEA